MVMSTLGDLKVQRALWAGGTGGDAARGRRRHSCARFSPTSFTSVLILLMAGLYLRCHAEITLLIKGNECTHFPPPFLYISKDLVQ